ncbi:MAG TPA: hypothetical protein VH592_13215 [Gemmataceae bacterium]
MKAEHRDQRRLINDMLAFARITTKARPFEPVDLKQIAQEIT